MKIQATFRQLKTFEDLIIETNFKNKQFLLSANRTAGGLRLVLDRCDEKVIELQDNFQIETSKIEKDDKEKIEKLELKFKKRIQVQIDKVTDIEFSRDVLKVIDYCLKNTGISGMNNITQFSRFIEIIERKNG